MEESLKNSSSEEAQQQLSVPPDDTPAPTESPLEVTVVSHSSPATTNDTVTDGNSTEDSPIPLFSEWAQKQMQEAEQKQREDEENGSIAATSRTSKPNGNKQLPVMKLRAKNYASPDCGAKILAANAEAQSTSSVLTAPKDEYLLNPCTSKIWFVVELCEPIQAEKIDLANFELFSSSPKDFSVSVSNRFPTREWQTVGKFTANDERTVQNFTLDPQVFGKFVRVEIHSHYNKEHYCPVSLFRVYGTSEFEAFETDNQPFKIVEADDFDDEDEELVNNGPKDDKNLLKVVGEAVGNIVKKAAEVLGKQPSNETKNQGEVLCQSITNDFECISCSERLRSEVFYLLQCQRASINRLRDQIFVRRKLMESRICGSFVNFPYTTKESTMYNYVTVMLPLNMSIALCNELKSVFTAPVTVTPPSFEEILTSRETPLSVPEPTESTEYVTDSSTETSTEFQLTSEMEVAYSPSDTQIPMPPPLEMPPLEENVSVEVEVESSLEIKSEESKAKPDEKVDEKAKEETSDVWENLDKLILDNGNNGIETSTPPSTNGYHGSNGQKGQQSESVFMRLSNRIKVSIPIESKKKKFP